MGVLATTFTSLAFEPVRWWRTVRGTWRSRYDREQDRIRQQARETDRVTRFGPDRFHPSAEGYRACANVLLPSVLAALDAWHLNLAAKAASS